MPGTNQEDIPPSSFTPPASSVNKHRVLKGRDDILAIRDHNPKEAIRLANDLCSKHDDDPLAHFTRGQVHLHCLSNVHDADKKKYKLLRDATDSFKRAVMLEPTSPIYLYSLAFCSFQLAKVNNEGYKAVVQDCESALSMGVFSEISIKNDSESGYFLGLKKKFQKLLLDAKAADQKREDSNLNINIRSSMQKAELVYRKMDKKLERTKEFEKKTGEFWRKLSYKEKIRMLDVKVEDVESFYQTGENKNLQALGILMEAVDLHRVKSHWVTWSCCFCKEDRKKEDYEVWSSIENHIGKHVGDSEPTDKGISDYEMLGNFDSVDINNGFFVLGEQIMARASIDDPIENNKCLFEWLSNQSDIKLALKSWESRRVQFSPSASMIFKQIANLKKTARVVLEQHAKQKQDAGDNTHLVLSNEVSALKEEVKSLERKAIRISTLDYREVIVPLLKHFIKAKLECEAEKQARMEADSIMAELIKEDEKDKKMHEKQKTRKKRRDGNRENVIGHVDVKSEERSEKSINDDNLKQKEGELKEGIDLEPQNESIEEEPKSQMQHLSEKCSKISVNGDNVKQGEGELKEGSDLEPQKESIEEGSKPQIQDKQASPAISIGRRTNPATSMETRTIYFGSFPTTLYISKSKQEDVAREAVDHQSENEDDASTVQ